MYVQVNLLGVPMHIFGGQIILCVFHVHIGGKVPARQSPSHLDVTSVATDGPPRGSNSEHAPVHRPRVSVSVSGVAPDAHYRDRAVACVGLAGPHDQEEDAAVLLRD